MRVRLVAPHGEAASGGDPFEVEVYPTGLAPSDTFAPHVPDATAVAALAGIIDRFKPDVLYDVHGPAHAIEAARDAGVPVVSMVGDYSWYCLQSFLVNSRLRRCSGPESARKCFDCLSGNYPLRWRVVHEMLKPAARAGLVGFRLWDGVALSREYSQRMRAAVDAFVVGDAQAQDFFSSHGIATGKITRIPQGLPAGALARREKERTAPVRDRPLRLAFVGRPHADKGIQVLAQAFDSLPRETPVELWIIHSRLATPELLRPLFRSADRFDADLQSGRIKLIRPVDQSRLFELIAKADVGVVPSIAYESPSLAMLEFVAQGTPIVRSESRGMEHVIQDRVNGRTFPYGDAGALAAVIREIVAEPEAISRWQSALPTIGSDDEYAARLETVFSAVRQRQEAATTPDFQHV